MYCSWCADGRPCVADEFAEGELHHLLRCPHILPNNARDRVPRSDSDRTAVGSASPPERPESYSPLVSPLSLTIHRRHGRRLSYCGTLAGYLSISLEESRGDGSSGYHADDDGDGDYYSIFGLRSPYADRSGAPWDSAEWIASFSENNWRRTRTEALMLSIDLVTLVAYAVLTLALVILGVMYLVLLFVVVSEE